MTIYVEYVIIDNIVINTLLLLLTKTILHKKNQQNKNIFKFFARNNFCDYFSTYAYNNLQYHKYSTGAMYDFDCIQNWKHKKLACHFCCVCSLHFCLWWGLLWHYASFRNWRHCKQRHKLYIQISYWCSFACMLCDFCRTKKYSFVSVSKEKTTAILLWYYPL